MNRQLLGGIAAGCVVAAGVGFLSADAPSAAMALALVPAAIAVAIATPGAVAAATLPAAFLTYRVGPSSFDMSMADLALMLAVVVALVATTRLGHATSDLLRLIAVYEVVMLSTVVAHPTSAAIAEWLHRAGLMAGCVIVGVMIVRHQLAGFAIRLLLITASVFSVAAVGATLGNGLQAAYPLGIHKNAAGSLLATVIALVATLPDDAGIPVWARRPLYFLLGAGLTATQSRGAMVGLAVALVVWLLLERSGRRLRVIALMTAAIGSLFVWNSVQTQLRTDVHRTGSLGIRERQQAQAWAAFETNTIRGAGIRYYHSVPKLARDGRPSNTAHETLAESGWVGLAGLATIVAGPFVIFRRRGSPWIAAALAAYGVRIVHGVVDNFWVAGPLTLPWLIIGIAAALSVEHPDTHEATEEPELTRAL